MSVVKRNDMQTKSLANAGNLILHSSQNSVFIQNRPKPQESIFGSKLFSNTQSCTHSASRVEAETEESVQQFFSATRDARSDHHRSYLEEFARNKSTDKLSHAPSSKVSMTKREVLDKPLPSLMGYPQKTGKIYALTLG